MDRDTFRQSVHDLLPGVSTEAIEIWIEDAEECVDNEQYVNFKEAPREEAVSAWLDTYYASFYLRKQEYGEDAAQKLVMLSTQGMCMFPNEMRKAAKSLGEGATVDQIKAMHNEGLLESDEFFPSLDKKEYVSTPGYKKLLAKPLEEITEDIFLRADAFQDAPWYDDLTLYTRIGTCTPQAEHVPELRKALKMMGYPTHSFSSKGRIYLAPGEMPARKEQERNESEISDPER